MIWLVVIFLAFGIFTYWTAEKQGEVGFPNLDACKTKCKVEKKNGQLVLYSSTQITKRGDFIGPLKCKCI